MIDYYLCTKFGVQQKQSEFEKFIETLEQNK